MPQLHGDDGNSGLAPQGFGVWGDAQDGPGIVGTSAQGSGVFGESTRGAGVQGKGDDAGGVSGTSVNNAGVNGTSINSMGVQGYSVNGPGIVGTSEVHGVLGDSTNGNGVSGQSRNGTGVTGQGGTVPEAFNPAGYGVAGLGTDIGVYAHNQSVKGHDVYLATKDSAGAFYGDVLVLGTASVGVLEITGGADLAEAFPVADPVPVEPGTVVIIDDRHPGHVRPSDRPYDRKVVGVVSGGRRHEPGILLGGGGSSRHQTRIALTGRVFCKAEAVSGPIAVGDFVTTSPVTGHAMKAEDEGASRGAVLGKAMSRLSKGCGSILVFINLQ
jgi:hypothetical protein